MSLRVRLSLIVSMLFLAGMALGLAFLLGNARQRVAEEMQSAATLAQQLLGAVLQDSNLSRDAAAQADLLQALRAIGAVRHLELTVSGDKPVSMAALASPAVDSSVAPLWFVYLVQAPLVAYEVPLGGGGSQILIRTNPADEIGEVWQETRSFIVLLLFVLLLLNGLLYFILGRWLAPVSAIVAGLEGVEHGDFSGSIPEASLPELKVIAEKLNQLTRVLRDSQAENERLSRHSLLIQEEERRHLARELHDELGQSISAIKAIAFSLGQRVSQDADAVEGAARIGSICNSLSGHVRSMTGRLRPALLDELGLVAALQVMIDEWNRNHSESFCSFRASGSFQALDDEARIGLYRIVQEALTNVAKHAGAERVSVLLREGQGQYCLQISDDGRGFDAAKVQQGMGLGSIRERCQALGGKLSLQAAPDAGVRIELSIPGER